MSCETHARCVDGICLMFVKVMVMWRQEDMSQNWNLQDELESSILCLLLLKIYATIRKWDLNENVHLQKKERVVK
jgi:hypothetical protein